MSISEMVDRGLAIKEQMKKLKAELEEIEGKLELLGLEREQESLVDEEREGRRWMARGSELVVPVIFTADKIMGQFKANSTQHQTARIAGGEAFPEFWELKQVYENRFDDGKKFRKRAFDVLGARGPAFVTACLAKDKNGIPRSDVKVGWEDAENL